VYGTACRLASPRRRHCQPSGAVSRQNFSRDVSAWTLFEIAVLCFTLIVPDADQRYCIFCRILYRTSNHTACRAAPDTSM